MMAATMLAIFQEREIGNNGRRSTNSTFPGAEAGVCVGIVAFGCSFIRVPR
jgi:hypothetical protein